MDEVSQVNRQRRYRNFRSGSCPAGLSKWTDTDLLERDLEIKDASGSGECMSQEASETSEEYLFERLEERERSIGINSFVQQESESKLDDSNLQLEFAELLSKYRLSIAGNLSRDNILSSMEVERENLLTEISELQAKLQSLLKAQREGDAQQLLYKQCLANDRERCELLQEWNKKLTREVKILRDDVKNKTVILEEYRANMNQMQLEIENGEARFSRIRLESMEVSKELEMVELSLRESKLQEHRSSVQIVSLMSLLENQAKNKKDICCSPRSAGSGSVVVSDISVGQVNEACQDSDGDIPWFSHINDEGKSLDETLLGCDLRSYSFKSDVSSAPCTSFEIFNGCDETIFPTTGIVFKPTTGNDMLTEYLNLTAAALIIKFPDVEMTKSDLIAAAKFSSYPDVYETMKNTMLKEWRKQDGKRAKLHDQVKGNSDRVNSDGGDENCMTDRYWSLITKPSVFISKLSHDIREKCGPTLLPSMARLTPHPLMFLES